MNTYSSFVIGYVIFWLFPFLLLLGIFVKTRKIEKKMLELEKQDSLENQDELKN